MVICAPVCVNMHRFASCPSRKKVITSYRQGAGCFCSLFGVSVYVCLTLPVTICFCYPQEGDLGWGCTTWYLLLQVTWQTFCLVFSCHISSAPFMRSQAACLQPVRLPCPVPSVWVTISVPRLRPSARGEGLSPVPYGTTLAPTVLAVLLHQAWQHSSTPRQTGCTADNPQSSHGSMSVVIGTDTPGWDFHLTLLHCVGIQGALRARAFFSSDNTAPYCLGPLPRTVTRHVINNQRYWHGVEKKSIPTQHLHACW